MKKTAESVISKLSKVESGRYPMKLSDSKRIGITALVPPEIIYGCGHVPVDLNNLVVKNREVVPEERLCAWAAGWRNIVLEGIADVDAVVVVAGGDCHNSLVEGQKLEMEGIPVHYYSYPFDGSAEKMYEENLNLVRFLGGIIKPNAMKDIVRIKKKVKEIDNLRCEGVIESSRAFELMVSSSDMGSDLQAFEQRVDALLDEAKRVSGGEERATKKAFIRAALLGVPPIFPDFHKKCHELGIQIVFDEMPFEFVRLSGHDIRSLSESYASYSFALPLKERFLMLKKHLNDRNAEAIIHYTQYACHHVLEDSMIRKVFEIPVLTLQGDLPGITPEAVLLRLESLAQLHRWK
ncbi:MAG: 2-hydroxyacyl-CoA dehydratase family protein [Thermoplasmata archaeon]